MQVVPPDLAAPGCRRAGSRGASQHGSGAEQQGADRDGEEADHGGHAQGEQQGRRGPCADRSGVTSRPSGVLPPSVSDPVSRNRLAETTSSSASATDVTTAIPAVQPATTMPTSEKNRLNGGNPSSAAMPASQGTARPGRRASSPRTSAIAVVPSVVEEPSGHDEQAGLGQSVAEHVQQYRRQPEGAAGRGAEGEQPHVLDAGVGEHPLVVALPQEQQRRDGEGQQARRR